MMHSIALEHLAKEQEGSKAIFQKSKNISGETSFPANLLTKILFLAITPQLSPVKFLFKSQALKLLLCHCRASGKT